MVDIKKIENLIDRKMIQVEKKLFKYVETKFIKDELRASAIVENLRNFPDYADMMNKECSEAIKKIGMTPDEYSSVREDIIVAIARAQEDISCMYSDAIARAEAFAKTAAVRDVFGEAKARDYWNLADKAWTIAEESVDSYGRCKSSRACVIEAYVKILKLMRDAIGESARLVGLRSAGVLR